MEGASFPCQVLDPGIRVLVKSVEVGARLATILTGQESLLLRESGAHLEHADVRMAWEDLHP